MQMAEGVDGCYCYAKARRNIFVMTMLLLNGNRFIVPKWRIERWMPKWQKKDWLRCVFLKFAYKCCEVQRTCKEERVGPVVIIGGNRC